MRKLTLKELNNKLKEKYPFEDIEFLTYQSMKEECQIQCNCCGTVYKLGRAESAFKKKNYFCSKCNDTPD